MTPELLAYLASRTGPVLTWPAPDGPDYEARDDGDDDWPDAALHNYTPEYGSMLTRGGW